MKQLAEQIIKERVVMKEHINDVFNMIETIKEKVVEVGVRNKECEEFENKYLSYDNWKKKYYFNNEMSRIPQFMIENICEIISIYFEYMENIKR